MPALTPSLVACCQCDRALRAPEDVAGHGSTGHWCWQCSDDAEALIEQLQVQATTQAQPA